MIVLIKAIPPPNAQIVKQAITTTGKAVDGYLVYSTVCLDLNMDGYCQLGDEPAATTQKDGSFKLEISLEQQKHENFKKAPLLVYGGYDVDTNKDFSGKLKAPFSIDANATVNITPITTIVEALIKDGKTKEEAHASVKTMFELDDSIDLGSDPVALKMTQPDLLKSALKLQKVIEVLATELQKADITAKKNDLINTLYIDMAKNIKENSFDKIITKVVKNNAKIPENAGKGAIALSSQIDTFFITSQTDSNAVIATKIGMVQREIKDKLENIANDGNFTFSSLGKDLTLLRAKEILNMVQYKGDNESVALKIKAALKTAGMTDTSFLSAEKEILALSASTDYYVKKIAVYYKEKIAQFEEDAKNNKLASLSTGLFPIDETFYGFKVKDNGDSELTIEYSILNFSSDNTSSYAKMKLKDGVFLKRNNNAGENDEWSFIDSQWKHNVDDTNETFTLSEDKKVATLSDGMSVKMLKEIDLANPATEEDKKLVVSSAIKGGDKLNFNITFSEGAKGFLAGFKQTKERYHLYATADGSPSSLIEAMEKGDHIFHVKIDGDYDSVSFESKDNNLIDLSGNKITQLQESTKGNIFIKKSDGTTTNVGIWSVKKLPTNDLVVILSTTDDYELSEKNLLAKIGDKVYKGEYETVKQNFRPNNDRLNLNKVALDDILKALKEHSLLN